MRIAAISDIHGNLAALDAVLADIAARHVDVVVNLGDILSGPLDPAGTADRLMPLRLPTIRGNHERQVLTGTPERLGLSDRYAREHLTEPQLTWIGSLPATLWLTPEVLLCHGTPNSDLIYFLESVDVDGARPATDEEVATRAGDCAAALIMCGHTHIPRIRRLHDGKVVVNPGSVGLPAYSDDHPHPHIMQTGSPHARYAIAERSGNGWTAELRAVQYDWDGAAALARQRNREDWAIALATGRL